MSGSTSFDQVFTRVTYAPTIVGEERAEPSDASAAGEFIIIMDEADGKLKASVNGGAFEEFSFGGAASITLDAAYDGGGAGLGRTITVDAGAVVLDNRQTSGTVLAASVGGVTVLLGALVGISADLSTNVTINGQAITGVRSSIGASTAGACFQGINTSATQVPIIRLGAPSSATGSSFYVGSGAPAHTTGVSNGDFYFRIDGGASTGIYMRTGGTWATVGGGTVTLDAAYDGGRTITVDAGAVAFDNRQTSGTAFLTNVGGATVLAGALIGHDIELLTNVTPGANAITGVRITTAATTRASTAGEGAFVIDSRATAARVVDCAVRNTGAADGIWVLRYGAATTLAATTLGLVVDLSTNVTNTNRSVYAVKALVGGGDLNTPNGVFRADYRGTNGTSSNVSSGGGIFYISAGAATAVAGGTLIGFNCDLSTNFTYAGVSVYGCAINIANTGDGTGILITNAADGGFGVDVQMTDGSADVVGLRSYLSGAATTASACLQLLNQTGTQVRLIRMSVPSGAAGVNVYVGAGAPAHSADVSNGDIYFRTDGAAGVVGVSIGTTQYRRIGGAWVAVC